MRKGGEIMLFLYSGEACLNQDFPLARDMIEMGENLLPSLILSPGASVSLVPEEDGRVASAPGA